MNARVLKQNNSEKRTMNVLKDGKIYNLGAAWGVYNKAQKCFMLGNCFVPKCRTKYAEWADA